MLDSDDTTTVPCPDDDEEQILLLNGSQRRGDFVEVKKPAKSSRIKPGSRSISKGARYYLAVPGIRNT